MNFGQCLTFFVNQARFLPSAAAVPVLAAVLHVIPVRQHSLLVVALASRQALTAAK